jgi:predicted transcriptional regulator
MIKALETAIEKVKALPEDQQRYAAHILEQIASIDEVYRLSDEERDLVREGLADLDAGRIVTDTDMDAFWRRHRA